MYKNLAKQLSSLQEPTSFEIKTFDELLAENVALAKTVLSTDTLEWLPLESDPYMKKLRVLTLRQIHNQVDRKKTVKQILLTTATGVNLDHLGMAENITRDPGENPYSMFSFSLLVESSSDIEIPIGLVLNNDDDTFRAKTKVMAVIPAGTLEAKIEVELESNVIESDIKTENLATELTFALVVKQLEFFKNGAVAENDDRYRLRIISSNDKHSTAGSTEAYKHFAYGSDSRIDDISIPNDNEPLDVNIYLASFSEVDEEMIKNVYEACNYKYTRPLGDNLTVKPAEIIEVILTATIELFDLLKQVEVDTQIKSNFENSFFIGQNFVKSDFIRKCHIAGVYKVESNFEDVTTNDKQIIKIKELNFNYKEASL